MSLEYETSKARILCPACEPDTNLITEWRWKQLHGGIRKTISISCSCGYKGMPVNQTEPVDNGIPIE